MNRNKSTISKEKYNLLRDKTEIEQKVSKSQS
jgi:hypothetical protein